MSAPTDTKPNICERGPLNGQAFTTSLSPDTKQMAYTSYEKTTDTIKARGSYNKTDRVNEHDQIIWIWKTNQ